MTQATPLSSLTIARRLAGLTQAALADTAGLSRAWISQLESGERVASPAKLELLARALQTNAEFLAEVHPAPLTLEDCNFRSLARVPAVERDRALGVGDVLRILIEEITRRDPDALRPPAVPVARHGWGDAFGDLEGGNPPERTYAAHELGHLVLHRDLPAAREPGDRPSRAPDQRLESQANAFAGAFLVPAAAWVRDAPRSTNPNGYLPHKVRWKVSGNASSGSETYPQTYSSGTDHPDRERIDDELPESPVGRPDRKESR